MRKELLIYLPTNEREVECEVRLMHGDPSMVIFRSPTGNVAIPIEALKTALEDLQAFNNQNLTAQDNVNISQTQFNSIEVSYGE
jgi:hypothetical protein